MAVVALITTGVMEHRALGKSLKRLFPTHEFVNWPPDGPLPGFTSSRVKVPSPVYDSTAIPSELSELATSLVGLVDRPRRQQRFDFVFVVEDLELVNQEQPETVVKAFRDAVNRYLVEDALRLPNDIRERVRQQCSFHLFRPLTEAYFFGEPAAIQRAGVNKSYIVSDDLERFETGDAEYLGLPEETDWVCQKPERKHHPKHYLRFLCDPDRSDSRSRYRETDNGVRALGELDWEQVVSAEPRCPFLHAFLDDLAYALDGQLRFIDQEKADPCVRFAGRHARTLRNL